MAASHEVEDLASLQSNILQNLPRDINCLSDGTKLLRRKTLEKLNKEVLGVKGLPVQLLNDVFKDICKPLLNLYLYPSDKCRELSVKLIIGFCQRIDEPWIHLPYIIPALVDRLGNQEILEQAEENRLLLVELLSCLIEVCKEKMDLYTPDTIQILQMTIVDPFPAIKKECCNCCQKLAAAVPEKFFHLGESLLPSLLQTVSHQHHKVRVVCLETIGVVIMQTSGKEVDNVVSHIAQRTFDHSPPVRLMVTDVVGDWLLNLRDRYSFFHKLLPLLLTGLSDELLDIRKRSKELFIQVGRQYENENEEDFKDKLDFQIVKHFEALLDEDRPSVGCRFLIQRNFSKILPALLGDITDWVVNTRIKSSQLLYYLIFYAEDHITMHLEPLIKGLYKSVQDEEEAVVTHTVKCAELVGLYVEPSIYCKLVLPQLQLASTSSTSACTGTISILTALVKGANPNLLQQELKDICLAVSSSDVCCTVEEELQKQLISFVIVVLSKNGLQLDDVSYSLFVVLLHVISMANNEAVQKKAEHLLESLSNATKFENLTNLFDAHGPVLLRSVEAGADSWTGTSPESLVFESLLLMADKSLPKLIDHAVIILKNNLKIEKDAGLRLKLFTLVSKLVLKTGTSEEIRSALQKYCPSLIRSSIIPNCTWQAGRVAATVRAASMSCLWSFLQAGLLIPELLKDVSTELFTQIISCLDDDNHITRAVTCKTVQRWLVQCKNSFSADPLNLIYPELLKRMDDSSDEIRIITTMAFSAFFKCLNDCDYDISLYQLHLEAVFQGLLIHLDDPNQEIQESVLESLKDAGRVHPKLLKTKLDGVKHKHRLSRYCNELSDHIDAMILQN